jgi:ABC-type sulfate transport system permease component
VSVAAAAAASFRWWQPAFPRYRSFFFSLCTDYSLSSPCLLLFTSMYIHVYIHIYLYILLSASAKIKKGDQNNNNNKKRNVFFSSLSLSLSLSLSFSLSLSLSRLLVSYIIVFTHLPGEPRVHRLRSPLA